VFRRHSALFAIFLVSGLLTRAGLAGASGEAFAERAEAPERDRASAPASLVELLAMSQATVAVEPDGLAPDWPAFIEARLEALANERERVREDRDHGLEDRIRAGLRKLDSGARVAVEVRDLERNVVLVSHGAERPLNPASNQKLITAIAAVELLGLDYRFQTTVSRAGDSLILRGEGDPDLHPHDLEALARETVARAELDGVTRIVIDDRAFDGRTLGPGFRSDGPGDSYLAPSGALAIDYATVAVTVRPGRHRQPAEISLAPAGAGFEVHNRARTGAGSLSIKTRAGEGGLTIVEIDGAIAGGHAPITVRRRVNDPGLVAAAMFAELLAAQTGEPALPVERELVPDDSARVIATHESASLGAVLHSALRYSNNFTAEQVLRTLAWRASDRPGSWDDGVEILERFAAVVSPDASAAQRFVNGSGLSREGRLSPRFVNDVVALVQRPSSSAEGLLESFAQAGGRGTLRNRLPVAGDRLLAKTGTYAGASTLSGVVVDGEGRRLGFSILINGGGLSHNRAVQDRIVAALLR